MLSIPNSTFDVVSIVPPHQIDKFVYLCDSHFHVEPIEDMFRTSETEYGVVIVLGEEAVLYTVDEHLRYHFKKKVHHRIPNNHCRGGQSQARIGRLRDEHIHHYISIVEEAIKDSYTIDGVCIIKRLVLSGPGQKKEQVRDRIGWLNIETTLLSFQTLEDVLSNFGEILSKERRLTDDEYISEIQENMRLNSDRLVFGLEQIQDCFMSGKLEKLWVRETAVWKNFPNRTNVIELNHYYLDDYGGVLGLLWPGTFQEI